MWKCNLSNASIFITLGVSRDITLLTNVHLVKAMVFPVVMYGYENWTIKKAECQRIDAFELWCCRRLFRVPWTARISNQSILKDISPEYSLEGQMLKLKLTTFLLPDVKNRLIGKDLDAANDWGQKENGTTEDGLDVVSDVIDIRLSRFQQLMMERAAQCAAESGTTEQLNWTDHRVKFLYLRIMYLRVCM